MEIKAPTETRETEVRATESGSRPSEAVRLDPTRPGRAAALAARRGALCEAMRDWRLDAVLVAGRGLPTQYGFLAWLAGYVPTVREAYLLLRASGEAVLFLPTSADEFFARVAGWDGEVVVCGSGDVLGLAAGFAPSLAAALTGTLGSGGRVGLVGAACASPIEIDALRTILSGQLELRDATAGAAALKAVKDADALAGLRAAARLADDALNVGFARLALGVSLAEIAGACHGRARALGAREVIVFCNAGPHFVAQPGDRRVTAGDLLSIFVEVAGPEGHWVELGRLAAAGRLAPAAARLAEMTLGALGAASDCLSAGRPVAAVAEAIDGVARGEGLAVGIWHGHGVGLDHDLPSVAAEARGTLAAGMVVALHPNFSDESAHLGASLAETFVVGAAAPEPLSRRERGLHRIA